MWERTMRYESNWQKFELAMNLPANNTFGDLLKSEQTQEGEGGPSCTPSTVVTDIRKLKTGRNGQTIRSGAEEENRQT